jgi:hypothetical protein
MKTGTVYMIEGTEAWERFRDAAKKMICVPKRRPRIRSVNPKRKRQPEKASSFVFRASVALLLSQLGRHVWGRDSCQCLIAGQPLADHFGSGQLEAV